MKLKLIDINRNLVSSWHKEFSTFSDIEVFNGSVFDYSAEAIVSPANSFGIMDGGLDGKLRDFLGIEIENKVRSRITESFGGELLVGQAMITETGNQMFPYLITAPTMRVPQDISTSINAYLAMKAILTVAREKQIRSLICSGLGSLSGNMRPDIVARQMRIAYEKVFMGKYEFSHWREEKAMEAYMKCETDYPPVDLEKPFL